MQVIGGPSATPWSCLFAQNSTNNHIASIIPAYLQAGVITYTNICSNCQALSNSIGLNYHFWHYHLNIYYHLYTYVFGKLIMSPLKYESQEKHMEQKQQKRKPSETLPMSPCMYTIVTNLDGNWSDSDSPSHDNLFVSSVHCMVCSELHWQYFKDHSVADH